MDSLYLGVSENGGTPKSSILIGFSIINHPFWVPLFGNTHIWRWTHMELDLILLFSECPKKLLTRSPSTALRRGPHFLAPRDFGCFPPDDFRPMEMSNHRDGQTNQGFPKSGPISNLRLANSKQYLSRVPTKSPQFWCEVIAPHTSYGLGPRNHISRTFAPARSVVSTPPHWEAPSNAVAGP